MLKKKFFCIVLILLLSSCNCSPPLRITSIQSTDKKLACKDIILEINEAEHYAQQASEAEGISLDEILVPTCWVTGYLDGNQAKKSSQARIEYLGHIYDLLDCGKAPPERPQSNAPKNMAPPPVAIQRAPQFVPQRMQSVPPAFNPGGQYAPRGNVEGCVWPDSSIPPYQAIPLSHTQKDPNLHSHVDKNGKVYRHSHPHNGAHKHSIDCPQ